MKNGYYTIDRESVMAAKRALDNFFVNKINEVKNILKLRDTDAKSDKDFSECFKRLKHEDPDTVLDDLLEIKRLVKDAFSCCLFTGYSGAEDLFGELGSYFERFPEKHAINSKWELIEQFHRPTLKRSLLGVPPRLSTGLKNFIEDRNWVRKWLTLTYCHNPAERSDFEKQISYELVYVLRKHIPTIELTESYGGSLMFRPYGKRRFVKCVAVGAGYLNKI